MFLETFFDFLKDILDLWTNWTSKLWNLIVRSFSSKLQLAFTDFCQLSATLHECFHLCENRVVIEIPSTLWCTFFDLFVNQFGCSLVDFFPFLSAFNGVLKILDALFNIPIKHIRYINLWFASLNNFIWDLMQQPRDSLLRIVIVGILPDHSHSVQQLRENRWDFSWSCFF